MQVVKQPKDFYVDIKDVKPRRPNLVKCDYCNALVWETDTYPYENDEGKRRCEMCVIDEICEAK